MANQEVVLYHGSLKELNSRSDKKYNFAGKAYFFAQCEARESGEAILYFKRILLQNNFNGLVNIVLSEDKGSVSMIQGTPIIHAR